MEDKCVSCPSISSPDGLIVPGPGGVPRADSAGSSSSEGPFAKEAPQTGHLVIMGTLGADGNPGSLPDVPKVGWAYVVEDPGAYGGVSATEGDIVYCVSLNPVKWGVLQADSDDSGRDLVSVAASFECREEPVQLPLCFYICFGYHWDDGETEGWSGETNVSQPEGFYLASGTEKKLASFSYPYTIGNVYIYASLGDVVDDYDPDPSGLSADRKASPSPSVLYSAAAGTIYAPSYIDLYSFSVGDSTPVVFDGLLSFTAGQSSRTRSATRGLSADPAPVSSSLFGPYTVSLRIVREADDADGSHFSVYATAVSAAAGASTPVLTLSSVTAGGTASSQEVDMSCLNDRITSVSAEVSCAGWRTAEDAEILAACCLRQEDSSGTCYGPDSASLEGGVLTVVWKTSQYARWLDADVRFASGEGRVRVDMSQIESLVFFEDEYGIDDGRQCPLGGCVWSFEDIRARAALESFSGEPDPSDPQYERIITAVFRLEERPASSLDVSARAADGNVTKSSSPLPCLDAALVSAKADASCAGRIVPAESAKFYITFSTGDVNYSEDVDARSGSFVLSGAHVDWAGRNYSSSSLVRLSFSVPGEDEDAFLSESANSFARVFNGTLQPGDSLPLSYSGGGASPYSLVIAERTELTSEDEGGPDVIVRFQIVKNGGPSVAVVAETLGGDVSVGAADLSCMVPPVFDGSVNGLVPVNSPATQTADLLSDDGTWMRPATDAEIDAIFA